MRALPVVLALVALAAVATPALASHTGCSPNGYGYDCHVHVGPVCEELDLRVGQSSTWTHCTLPALVQQIRDLLP